MQYTAFIVDPTYVRGQQSAALNTYNAALGRFQGRLLAAGFEMRGQIGIPSAYDNESWYQSAPAMAYPAFFLVSPAGTVIRRMEGNMFTTDRIYNAINSIVPISTLPPRGIPQLPNRPVVAPPIVQPQLPPTSNSNLWLLLVVAGITYIKMR